MVFVIRRFVVSSFPIQFTYVQLGYQHFYLVIQIQIVFNIK